ncbi:MAG: TraR/DksA C4-type zinc finger protein [Rhodospirillaceae bacterium]
MQITPWQDVLIAMTLDTEAFKKRLEAERETLMSADEAAAEDRAPVELDQQSVGRLSRMDAMQVQAMAQAVGVRREERLKQIEAALKRIEDGEYGECLECGEAIPLKRLEIDPAVACCVNCVG